MKNKRGWCLAGSCVVGAFLSISNVFAFNSFTHRYVTETSLKNISEINKNDFCFDKSEEDYWNLIADYSLKPDEDEIEGAFKYHFYNPVTEKNFMGERMSALTKFTNHYNNAVSYYEDGAKTNAYKELGRAIHFMEDLNTPVHTGYNLPVDAVVKFPFHLRFEKICDRLCHSCSEMISLRSLKYFNANSIETIAKSCAILSENSFYYLTNVEEPDEETLARNAVLNAQNKVTGIFYKFFKQICKIQ